MMSKQMMCDILNMMQDDDARQQTRRMMMRWCFSLLSSVCVSRKEGFYLLCRC